MLSRVHLASQKSPLVLTSHLPADATITMHSVRRWRDGGEEEEGRGSRMVLGGGRGGEPKHELPSTVLSRVSRFTEDLRVSEPGPSVGSVSLC